MKALIKKATLPTLALCYLTGCQTTPITANTPVQRLTPQALNSQYLNSQALNSQQSQKLLVSTIKSSLYHNQDFIAEQQLFLQNQKDSLATKLANSGDQPSRLQQIEQCQSEHDKALVTQLKADKITTYKAVKKLADDKKAPYETIKKAYIDCYHTAENLPESEDDITSDLESTADSEDYPEQVGMAMKVLGFKSGQVANFNNYFAKSGKILYTGNYRPYQGKLALQIDAGFENKNLRTHYRLPMVADIKNQSLYLKPDFIMPYTALYLDNKLGMSWQDKWYQFNPDPQKSLPANITAKAWLKAVTDSFLALPSEQFSTATPAEISSQLLPNLAQSTQKPNQLNSQNLVNNQVIHWHQTAEQQIALTKATIEKYIAIIEQNLANDKTFLALPESEQTRYRKLWQKQKKHLLAYSEGLSKKPNLATAENSEYNVDNDESTEPTAEAEKDAVDAVVELDEKLKTAEDKATEEYTTETTLTDTESDDSEDEDNEEDTKSPLLASRPQGQDWYFILNNNQLKHIYIDNGVTVVQQPANVRTWITFNPDNAISATLATANQPQTLENLAKTLRPEVTIDGRAEMKRLAELDDSRRLFGQEPKVVKYYKDYMKKSKQKAKKDSQ